MEAKKILRDFVRVNKLKYKCEKKYSSYAESESYVDDS